MQDLNDVQIFAAVVEHNGFSAAARALDRPKSSISRHVDRLEARLGVRLLERSTRRLRLTEIGADYHARCRAALVGFEEAERAIALHRTDPVGIVRLSCPTGIAKFALGQIVPGFMARFPEVRLLVKATNDAVDLIGENIDVAIRARARLNDESLTMRRLGASRLIFVASPEFVSARAMPSEPVDAEALPFLSFQEGVLRPTWTMRGRDGTSQTATFDPVLWSSEIDLLVTAACAGSGLALLPIESVTAALSSGKLVRVLNQWHSEDVTVHLVFPTNRRLRPAVRVLIDYIVEQFDRDGDSRILSEVPV